MDTYQGSLQHTSIIAQNIPRETPCLEARDIDHARSWVMLRQNGAIEPLENEQILLQTPNRVSFDLSVPPSLRTANSNFTVKCDDGIAYITNKRVIYLAARPTDTFQSFSAFILDVQDPRPGASGWLGMGPWCWTADATPRAGGGIPGDIPRVTFVLTFKNGGMDGFKNKFSVMYERLVHARDIARATGQRIGAVHDDDLPPYSPAEGGSTPATQPAPVAPATSAASPAQATQPTPSEPPPDYDEAQAQAVEIQFEERERQDAEREQ